MKTGSLFLLSVDSMDLARSDGLLCKVMDYDQVGAHEFLGACVVPRKALYQGEGERLEFKLGLLPGEVGETPTGFLAIRCRRASEYDIKFIQEYKDESSFSFTNLTALAMSSQGGASNLKSLIAKRTRILKNKDFPNGIKQVRYCGYFKVY